MSTHLRFAPEILARLGEELVPHPDLGVLELVRNAYDADATRCEVNLTNAFKPGGTLVVTDNGHGMSRSEIENGFLHIGRSGKTESQITAHFGRRRVGEKGLGRLASLRLGREVELITRPASAPGTAHRLTIDWSAYDNASSVDAVKLEVETYDTSAKPGTTVIIKRLRENFAGDNMKRLSRALILLSGAFVNRSIRGRELIGKDNEIDWSATDKVHADPGFFAFMETDEYKDLALAVNEGYFDECEFRLVATVDEEGQASAILYDWRGERIETATHSEVADPGGRARGGQPPARFWCPPTSFEFWMFLRDAESFKRRQSSRNPSDVALWLDVVGGVHLFHRGLRTHPYGDAGHDWLDLNLSRNQDPQHRPSTNNSIGKVSVDDLENVLIPKTDRMGFQENLAFQDLQIFAKRAVGWSSRVRKTRWEKARTGDVAATRQKKKKTRVAVDRVLKNLPVQDAETVRSFLDTNEKLIAALERDRLLYRSLATVGISTAVFAHETLNTSGGLVSDLELIDFHVKSLVGEADYVELIEDPIGRASRGSQSIHSFAKLPLRMLRRGKRKLEDIDVNFVAQEFVDMFGGYIADWQIKLELDLCMESAIVRGAIADVESIYANLVVNAARAFTRGDSDSPERRIRVRTRVTDTAVIIEVADSGPGIRDVVVEKIWEPGEGGDLDGTGLGLTIIKDIIADLHGKKRVIEDGDLAVAANGELGGAEFFIRLPRRRSESSNIGAS